MKPERLATLWRDAVAFDLETHLTQPGLAAPPVVCGSLAVPMSNGQIAGELLFPKSEILAAFAQILAEEWRVLTGANIAFDVICMAAEFARTGVDIMPQIFAMYDPTNGAVRGDVDGRVLDVQHTEALHAIAQGHLGLDPYTGRKLINPETKKPGRYSLGAVVEQVLGRDNAKVNDRFRGSYALLEHVPLDAWPIEARTYPVDDATNTLEVALAQTGYLPSHHPHVLPSGGPGSEACCQRCGAPLGNLNGPCIARSPRRNLHDVSRQTYTALAMSLGGAWGYHVNIASVDALEAKYNADHSGSVQPFVDAGFLRANGSKCESAIKLAVARAYGARDVCPTCNGSTKVPSPKTNGRTKINCRDCDGTGLLLPIEVPRSTPKNPEAIPEVSIGRDPLQESGDELLMSFADHCEGEKIPATYIPFLRGRQHKDDTIHPGMPLTLFPNPILETGRTSYNGVVQLLPRTGGIRECIEARPGTVFSSEDYKAGELVTHAEDCHDMVGFSKLGEALNLGLDAHLAGAATILGISYEEAKKRKKAGDKTISNVRQAFKPANFGFPGGMGAPKLVLQQRKQGPDTPHPSGPTLVDDGTGTDNKVPGYKGLRFCLLMGTARACGEVKLTEWNRRSCPPSCKKCLEAAQQLREFFFKQWPENGPYFEIVGRLVDEVGEVAQFGSDRIRGGVDFCSAANGFFQGRLADAAKNALMAASRECYDRTVIVQSSRYMTSQFAGGGSPLLGSRIIVFQHDEIVSEHPESIAHEAATRMSEIMVEALRWMCPKHAAAVEAEPTLMRKLYKGAEKRTDANGRLIPWEPKK